MPRTPSIGTFDVNAEAARALAEAHGATAHDSLDSLLAEDPDVVVVAASHDRLAELGEAALDGGAHVLVEKPAGVGTVQIRRLQEAADRNGRQVKVGFNHRFHPASPVPPRRSTAAPTAS